MSAPDSSEDLQVESDRLRADFLRTDLELCFTFADVAEAKLKRGDHEGAEQALSDAKKGHEAVGRFLSDPKHAKNLTTEELSEFTGGLERLRKRLDEVRQLTK